MFKRVVLGGTFDCLHAGHKALLRKALKVGKNAWIGLTTDKFARKRKKHEIKPYKIRKKQLMNYLRRYSKRIRIFPLTDQYGPAAKVAKIDAIVVSRETKLAAMRLNKLRRNKGLPYLKIISIPMVRDREGIVSCRKIHS